MSIEARNNNKGERRYEVRLRDPSGREYSRTFRTKKEAERFEDTRRAPRTVRRQYDTLRAILNAAVEVDLIARSPCRRVKLPEFHTQVRPVLDAEGLARLAEAVGPELGAMVYVGAVLGLRWGEVAGLRVGNLDFLGRSVTVAEQRNRGQGGHMLTRLPKTDAGHRTLTAPSWLMDLLAEHLRHRELTAVTPAELVFVATGGEGLDYSHWRQRVWLPAVERAGFVGLQFHDLRRTAATALVTEGIDIKTAQTRLGHADPRTTLGVYAQATLRADRDAAERLGVHFHPPVDTGIRPARGINAG